MDERRLRSRFWRLGKCDRRAAVIVGRECVRLRAQKTEGRLENEFAFDTSRRNAAVMARGRISQRQFLVVGREARALLGWRAEARRY